jgi:hypothetical protein
MLGHSDRLGLRDDEAFTGTHRIPRAGLTAAAAKPIYPRQAVPDYFIVSR